MDTWEDFAAFGDIAELDYVCYLLEEHADAIRSGLSIDLADIVGEKSHLVAKLENQDRRSLSIIERERPGLYPRTWMAHQMYELYLLLNDLSKQPVLLPEKLPQLERYFHRVLVAAHDIFDSHHRARLISAAMDTAKRDGVMEGVAQEKASQSQKARDAVRLRSDQQMRAAFGAWAVSAIASGKTANTVNNLQALDGFLPEWSQVSEKTLKTWAREAGFTFKAGRPSRNR